MTGGAYTTGSAWETVVYSVYEVRYWIKYTFKSLGMLITGKAGLNDLSGPVGVSQVVDEVYTESKSYGTEAILINLLNLAVLFSANLGVINLLPFPALDGGRLVFLLIEAVTKKKVPAKVEGIINAIGFVLLMLLMAVVFFNDIRKIFVH